MSNVLLCTKGRIAQQNRKMGYSLNNEWNIPIISGVNLPASLYRALESDSLVVFAGAGVSKQGPNPLDDFETLVKNIDDRVNITRRFAQGNAGPLETYLGRLEAAYGKNVRTTCADLLSGGSHSELHRNILSLFKGKATRVVTTNFDLRFESASTDEEMDGLRVFSCPALPLGDDFNGLVHLHGTIERPEEMVLTDADYGRAYVTDSWASRFLVKAFERYTVLFVGYSFGDTLMQYLTRSISVEAKGRLFALVRSDEDGNAWLHRGIVPVVYDNYEQLPDIFAEWGRRSQLSVYDNALRVEQLARLGADASEDDVAELRELFCNQSEDRRCAYAKAFAREADGLGPLEMLAKIGMDGFLFDEILSKADEVLLDWAVSHLAIGAPMELLSFASERRRSLSRRFLGTVARELGKAPVGDEVLAIWATRLGAEHFAGAPLPTMAIAGILDACGSPQIALAYIDILFSVIPSYERDLLGKRPTRPSPAFAIQDVSVWDGFGDELRQAIMRHAGGLGEGLFLLLASKLEEAWRIQTTCGRQPNAFDPLSFGRTAIEEHEQNHGARELIDVLVDVMRDTTESLPATSQERLALQCMSANANLNKRVGLHILTRLDCPADELMDVILDNGCLGNYNLLHETFAALLRAYPSATQSKKEALVEAALGEYPDLSDKNDAYGRFNLFSWLKRCSPEDGLLSKELAKISKRYPYFEQREYPDLTHYSATVVWNILGVGCRIPKEEFDAATLRKRFLSPHTPDSFETDFERVAVPMRQHPDRGLDVALSLFDNDPDETSLSMASYALESIPWQQLSRNNVAKAQDLILRGLSFGETYKAAIRAALDATSVEALTHFQKTSVRQEILDAIIENEGFVHEIEEEPGTRASRNWVTAALNMPHGMTLQLLARTVRTIAQEDVQKARQVASQYLPSFAEKMSVAVTSGAIVCAAFGSSLNLWASVVPDIVSDCFVPQLGADTGNFDAAWQGIAHLGSVSADTWRLIGKAWKAANGYPKMDDGRYADNLLQRYIWTVVRYEDAQARTTLVSRCADSQPADTARTILWGLTVWMKHLSAELQLDEWNSWLRRTVEFILEDEGRFHESAHYLITWMEEFDGLSEGAARILISKRSRRCKGCYIAGTTIRDTVTKLDVTEEEKALLLVFFLNNCESFVDQEEFSDALETMELTEVSLTARRELRDAFAVRGIKVPDGLA